MRYAIVWMTVLMAALGARAGESPDLAAEMSRIKRVYVEKMTGGETAAQIRDMMIGSLQRNGLFIVTENLERADGILRGSAEDLVFTDTFQSSEGINAHVTASVGGTGTSSSSRTRGTYGNLSVGENESTRIAERKHEAVASVRLVNKDGDVIWSTTQESLGAKFRGASADVAEKVTRQLMEDLERSRKKKVEPDAGKDGWSK